MSNRLEAILTSGAGQAAGSLVGPVTDAGKGIYSCLKRKYDYIKHWEHNFKALENEANYLFSREKDVKKEIELNRVMMEPTQECLTWLEEVEMKSEHFKDLNSRYEIYKGSCGPRQLFTRLNLSKSFVKLTNSVIDLKDRMSLDHKFLRERPVERVHKSSPMKINVSTLCKNVEKLIEFLKDSSITKVGIWGMPGVGKTTILETLSFEVEKNQMFDIVIWVTVPKQGDPFLIQQKILKQLNVKVDGIDDQHHAATLISNALENRKYLLLLDEVTSEINFCDIGISSSHMQGKVVVATRERNICDSMELNEDFQVDRLSREDARKLFRDVVGDSFEHPGIRPIAEKVLKQCGDLPHVIKAVGIHLKGRRTEDFWRNTLSKLQSPNMGQLKYMEEVFTAFRLIYEELEENLKNCLLYGASFPEDYDIYRDYLVECWKAEQLIGIDHTLREACEEGNTNVENLIDKCLFDRCKNAKYVKMPIIFRNSALRVAKSHQNFDILFRKDEEIYPSVEKWKDARVISLMKSGLHELPENPECPSVSSIFLQKNENLLTIPALFFKCMPTLKVIDLCETGIKVIPSSICELTSLRGLYLNGCCHLMHLPDEVEKLNNLEILDIRNTGIHGLQEVMGKLTSLRCLRVSFSNDSSIQNHVQCNGADVSPSEVCKQLLFLEELAIEANPPHPRWNEIAPEIAVQVAQLRNLSALSFYFPTIQSLQNFTRTRNSRKNGTSRNAGDFRSFNIFVGSHHESHNLPPFDVFNCSGRRYLVYSNGKGIPDGIKDVLQTANAFRLIGHQDVTCFTDFGIHNMEFLEVCEVKECNAVRDIVGDNVAGTHAFRMLRELYLFELQQCNCICQGPVASGTFAQLTTLSLCECRSIEKVITTDMAKNLRKLQHLRIEKCCRVKEVIETGSQAGESDLLPKLQTLELVSLEGVEIIHAEDCFEWLALQQVVIVECEKLTSFCLNKTNATKLRSIKCSEAWWGSLTLDDQVRAHLQAFCFFIDHNYSI
ncbi:probable disease resistance protein At4g27220 [Amaranthus tricolor]|uniref:probable disease resistance protein At4g27220 n=1 Tax=Amaranthus tricolor TaxID=29722 RepID=UPI002586D98D|nr:probable disease resistance protein At4g27220 [Amaranthus tricolor]